MDNFVLAGNRLFWQSIDWIYPPSCAGCGKPGSRWCSSCHLSIQLPEESCCSVCGLPLKQGDLCDACNQATRSFYQLRYWGIFDGSLRNAIHRMKYQNDIGLADVFHPFMCDALSKLNWDFDLVVPVPLNHRRKRERGYNQSALLAKPIARFFHQSFSQNVLIRIKDTVSQTTLNVDERKKNVSGAFTAVSNAVSGKKVLLIDDLATTCATVDACSSALISAGAKIVFAFTLARTL